MSEVAKILNQIGHNRMQSEVFASFARMAACCLAAGLREEDYLEEAKRWKREELSLFSQALGALINEMEEHPFRDRLGSIYMEMLGGNAARGGEFHTPAEVCELMANLIRDPLPPEGPIRLAEPACGSGAQILAFAKSIPAKDLSRLRVQAVDISRVACDLCLINTTLWNIPTVVIHGNTLSLEQWGAWANWPMIQAAPITCGGLMKLTVQRLKNEVEK